MQVYKVVFHIDESFRQRAEQILANITNLLNDMGGENLNVELLANGSGVQMLKKDAGFKEKIEVLSARGVQFVACAHSLEKLDLKLDDLLESIKVVPAGVSELDRKQAEGWAYIRP